MENEKNLQLNDEPTNDNILEKEDENSRLNKDSSNVDVYKNQDEIIKIDKNVINDFILKNLITLLGLNIMTFIPEILVITLLSIEDHSEYFANIWWVLVISIPMSLFTSFYAYYDKKSFLNLDSKLIWIFFPLYVISIMASFSVGSLYSPKLMISLSFSISFSILLILILNVLTVLRNKLWLQLSIIYTFIFIFIIIYVVIVSHHFVIFFVLCLYILMYSAYLITQLKRLLIEFVKEYEMNPNIIPFKINLSTIMIINIDLLAFTFK